ncbi:MAG: hypothetical protein IT160_09680 [Bryobacterales bacterium]|nr:hypothetical protein [Bryobacterales bacterium]
MSARIALVSFCLLSFVTRAAEPAAEAIYRGFQNPPASYSISPYWFWNGKITAEETRRQIGEMARQGVRGAVIMNWAGLEPAYLSEAWWREVGAALESASANGVTLNFSDEYLWPSGHARDYGSLNREPSRVLQLHPEYRMRRLSLAKSDAEPELVVAARVDTAGAIDENSLKLIPVADRGKWRAPGAGWKLFTYTAVPAFERNTRVDLLNPAAVRVFIDLVYEEFARRFPRHLGTTIRFFVSDHEGTYGAPLPFTPALWETFHQRHGYDLRPFLPIVDRPTARAAQVRQDYLETLAHLYSTSFVGQVTDWCRRHGVEHGHSDIEETLRFQVAWTADMFALWRASSAVYIDALLERGRMPIDFMEALSVAHFEKRPLMVENQGLVGSDSYWSIEKARRGTNMCLSWGTNRLIGHYFEYDPTHLQYPPSYFLTQPLWRYFHNYADLSRRALFMNAQGRHDARIAIYYPLESAFAGSEGLFREDHRDLGRWHNSMDQTQNFYTALQLELSRLGWEYHIVDSHYLRQARLDGKSMELAGERFPVLILPPMTHMSQSSIEQSRRFAAGGGLVLALGNQPAALSDLPLRRFPVREHPPFMDRLDYAVQIQAPGAIREDLAPLFEALRAAQPPEVEVTGGTRDHLFFSHRSADDMDWYWAVNDSDTARSATVRFRNTGTIEKWDPATGKRFTLAARGAEVTLDFGPWDAYFVVRRESGALAPRLPGGTRRVLVTLPGSGWRFTPEEPVRVPYAWIEGSPEPVWLAPERLANRNWWLAGPYPCPDHGNFFDSFPPEKGFKAGDPAWKWTESSSYNVEPKGPKGIYYAFVNVWSPVARKGRAAVAAFDGAMLWWNGKRELTVLDHPPFVNVRDAWAHRPPIEIRQGWNTVLLKIGPAQAGATGFVFRITDEQDNTLRDLIYSRDRTLTPNQPRRVRMRVDAPPGTAGPSIAQEIAEDAIPEHAISFAPRTETIQLASWTDSTLANYSGTALYEIDFTLPQTPPGERLVLDLGSVGLAAEVWLNGRKAGERVWRPYELDVTEFVQPGPNRLRVRVANSNAGWMAQGDPIYRYGNWGVKFHSERDRLTTLHPNGLEGPVRMLAVPPGE